MKIFVYLIVSAGLVLVTACGSASAMPIESKSDEVPLLATPILVNSTNEPIPPPAATDTLSAVAQKMTNLSRENLSQKLKISFDQIKTEEVKPAIWPDSSLGCPKADMVYAQVLTPGFLVRLEVDGKQYLYHTDENETVIHCKGDELPVFPLTPSDIQDGIPWVPVD